MIAAVLAPSEARVRITSTIYWLSLGVRLVFMLSA